MSREGAVDPWTGQRPAFPLESSCDNADDARVVEYMLGVREEARTLALASVSLKRPASLVQKRPVPASAELDYAGSDLPLTEIVAETTQLFSAGLVLDLNGEAGDRIVSLYHKAHASFARLAAEHPAECTTLATWKAWTAHHEPVPVSHADTFRLYKYLVRWIAAQPPSVHFRWAWSLLLRTPDLLNGDEVSVLRDLCRSLLKHRDVPLARAFVHVVGTVFRQRDLLAAQGARR